MYWSTPLLLWFIELFERNQDIPHFLNRLFKNQILLTVVIVLIIEQVLNIPFSSSDFEIVFPACQVSSQPFSSQTCTWQGSINGSYTTKFNSTISIDSNTNTTNTNTNTDTDTNTNTNITINIDSTWQGSINGSLTTKFNSTNINTYIDTIY